MPTNSSLLAAYILDGEGGGKKVNWEQINSWKPEDGILWVHLDFTAKRTAQWLRNIGLSKLTTKTLTIDESRPRSITTLDTILLILRGINLNSGQDPEDMVSIRIWVDKHRIITTRRRKLLSIDDIKNSIDDNIGPKSTAEFINKLIDHILDRIAIVVDSIEDHIAELEEALLSADTQQQLRAKIAEVRRESIIIRRYLAPQREALNRLLHDETSLFNTNDKQLLSESLDRTIRYIEDLDSARDRATITHEEFTSRLSEQMDRRMYILSLVAIIFLPLTFITGLLGINVAGIPGSEYPGAFFIVCSILFFIMIALGLYLWKKKWM